LTTELDSKEELSEIKMTKAISFLPTGINGLLIGAYLGNNIPKVLLIDQVESDFDENIEIIS
jgi:hypothetical protein